MSEYAGPSAEFTARTYDWPTGLAGTIGVAILLEADRTVVTARSTAGITEDTTGVYKVTLTAPATAGEYLIYWTDAASAPTVTAEEELVVTTTLLGSGGDVDLCTRAQVLRDPTLAAVGSTMNDLIDEIITQASRDFMAECGREIVLLRGTNPQARDLDVGGYYRDREIPVGDLASTPTAVALVMEDGTTAATLTVAVDVEPLPRFREAWEPITALRLRYSAGTLAAAYRLRVTGTWGWPAVPEDVQLAVRDTVVFRMRQHRAVTQLSPDQFEEPEGPQRAFPLSAWKVIERYRLRQVGGA